MASGWFYGHDEKKLGPFSQRELKEFAATGEIRPDDTVWKEGVEQGVPASRVRYLFAQPTASPPAVESSASEAIPYATETSAPPPPVIVEAPPAKPTETYEQVKNQPKQEKKGTATVIKGAIMAGQDGYQARYRMKCSECGHVDSSCRTIRITNKLSKSNFFCPKCKKRREVVIQCRQ